MNRKLLNTLFEYYGVDPSTVPDYTMFWALYATSFYERLFKKIDDEERLEKLYNFYMHSSKLDKRAKKALTFFYNIRRDEMADPDYWSKVGGKKLANENKKEPMKAKFVNEYFDSESDELSKVKMEAERISKEEGVVQHVNEIRPGVYRIEDWYDSDQTVASYENGRILESLNESMSRYCDFYKTKDGKWYMDLASNEYGEWDDATTYGPFNSEEAVEKYLDNNFSNPGGMGVDDSGEREVPTESPNGSRVVRPGGGGGGMMMGGYGRRW